MQVNFIAATAATGNAQTDCLSSPRPGHPEDLRLESTIKVLAVIPARGGSKGVPRKNLRPLAGKPLIWHVIQTCLSVRPGLRVVVSTDDDEIALFAERFGAAVIRRPAELAGDAVTLDPVIVHAAREAESRWREHYELVVTVQPTCPLLAPSDLQDAVAALSGGDADTVLSVVDDHHLCWTLRDGVPAPAYAERVNRQQLPANFRETGAIIACRREQLELGSRIGRRVALHEVPRERSLDIDTPVDFYLCESILLRRRIVFAVVGNAELGLGHAYRAITLAHELVRHSVSFVCPRTSGLAIDYIRKHNYPVDVCEPDALLEAVLARRPHLVINDILDTGAAYVQALKSAGASVINFEDLGDGGRLADLVVNALYPYPSPLGHVLVGADYFCLRDEFLHLPDRADRDAGLRVLVTFGGVDEGDLTARVLKLLVPLARARGVQIEVITGPGYAHGNGLAMLVAALDYPELTVIPATRRISDHMCRADLAITSGGRTVLELAALRVPTIVICQNARETTHAFVSDEDSIVNLGYRGDVSDAEVARQIARLLDSEEARSAMRARLEARDFSQGKRRVIERIEQIVRQP
jgi:CMP-N-acetylneuraminic acid synthetase/spore coat polysaccharide biosynthesis predicted glycosyltransferase SpsG